jgi:ABC-type amino acid transport substrate-binding protein
VIDTPFAESQKLRKGAHQLDYKEFSRNDFPAQVSPHNQVEEYAMAVSVREPKLLNAINAVLADLKQEDKLKLIYQDAIGEFKAVKGIAADVPYGTAPDNQQLGECGGRKPAKVMPPR